MRPYVFSDVFYDKVLDADFETKISGVLYSTSPREVITIGDIELFYSIKGDGEHE